MFTGIINGQGKVLAVESRGHETRFRIQALYDLADIILGESIAVNGTCLTVATSGPSLFSAYASAETMQRTALGLLKPGAKVNLERALAVGDRPGGHIVSGPVDCVAGILSVRREGESRRHRLRFPASFGAGDIGTECARRGRAVHPASRTGVSRSGRANADFDAVHSVTELDQLLPETDLLFMSLPSVSDTVNILNAERMALLPKGAYVVNVGRGTAIDQDALIKALDSGHLAGAALDVVVPEPLPADHPLRKAKNLLLTPHVAGNMTLGYTCERNVQLFCENLENYAAGRPMHHLVDRRKGY